MAIIEWQQKKETFNTEKNYFDITYEVVSRETSDEEDRLEKLACLFDIWGMILGVSGVFMALFGCSALGALSLWVAFGIVAAVSVGCMLLGFVVFLNKGVEYDRKLSSYQKEHDVWHTPEVQALKKYNEEQNEFAAEWRAAHPLEEKIRACLLDPKSSVDVANLARYYAECYLKGDTGPEGPPGPKGDCPKCPFDSIITEIENETLD